MLYFYIIYISLYIYTSYHKAKQKCPTSIQFSHGSKLRKPGSGVRETGVLGKLKEIAMAWARTSPEKNQAVSVSDLDHLDTRLTKKKTTISTFNCMGLLKMLCFTQTQATV